MKAGLLQPPMLSRREFLARSARAIVGASLGSSLLFDTGCGSGSGATTQIWRELAKRISGPVLRPGDPDFAALALPQNLRYASVIPAGIARCLDASDVSQAILWAREHGVPLVARSGGHSYAGYSTTTGLMIDLKRIDQIQFDSKTRIATVGGGVLNGAMYQALRPFDAAITHGRCPSVGAAGFLLGGGIGFDMRAHRLGCDQLIASQIVLANGDILTLPDDDADLFWACQGGGGGNFGINTSFSLQTFSVPASLTVFKLAWTANPDALYPALLEALAAAPNEFGSRVQLTAVTPAQRAAGQDVQAGLLGQLSGSPADLAGILAPVYAIAQPAQASIQRMNYWDAQIGFLASSAQPGRYQERSRFFAGPISSQAIAAILQWARQWPGTSGAADVVLFQTGGRINSVAPSSTAFVHRDSDWLMTIALTWGAHDSPGTIAANLAWQSGLYSAISPFASGGAYQNFVDPSLIDWAREYYGDNLPRLQRIKAAADPAGVFKFPEAIAPA